MLEGKVVYLSGKIDGEVGFKRKFATAKYTVLSQGAKQVINPAELPDGWTYQQYMAACMALIPTCDVLVQLPCWVNSPGATAEAAYCKSLGKPIIPAPLLNWGDNGEAKSRQCE